MAFYLHKRLARPEGLEPPTLGLEVRRSVQLSYGRRYCDHSPGPAPRSGRRAVNSLHPRRNVELSASIVAAPLGRYRRAGTRPLRPRSPNAKTRAIRITDVSGPARSPAGPAGRRPVA